jgi:sec-independent protein translocase protein TatA
MLLPKFGPLELMLILVIVAMLFGVGKLPEVFGAVGKGVKEFRRNANDADNEPAAAEAAPVEAAALPAPAPAPAAVAAPAAAPAPAVDASAVSAPVQQAPEVSNNNVG